MTKREVYNIGQIVYFGGSGEIKGEIETIIIHKNYEEYRIIWWNNEDKKSIILKEHEFTTKKAEKVALGFKN
jgi:hypothetical protein